MEIIRTDEVFERLPKKVSVLYSLPSGNVKTEYCSRDRLKTIIREEHKYHWVYVSDFDNYKTYFKITELQNGEPVTVWEMENLVKMKQS